MQEEESLLQALLSSCAQGDRKSFQTLYQKGSPKLYSVAMRLLGERGLADEALQEAFVHIWYNAREYHCEKGHPMVWMISIVRYRALDIMRREGSQRSRKDGFEQEQRLLMDPSMEHELADEINVDVVELKELQACLDLLKDNERESVLLSYYYGFSHGELVEKLKSPLGTIKSWIRRGMESVRECMQP